MKNLFKTTFLLFALTPIFFSSCEKCKDCQMTFETINGYNSADLDASASLLGYPSWNAYVESLYPNEEYCGEALDAAEDVDDSYDLDGDGTNDYRLYWNCN